ncbi:MAG: FAD-dependent oxidoreductase [Planctomycetes bacterium]|nr:FAD-dependent oxidoreductase [Planctomycetota bacterium]
MSEGPRLSVFTFEGREIAALAGQSIAAALYAAGVRVFSRSFKYHRPRGLLCVAGDCPNCLMRVDGVPNVRTCIEPVRGGQTVERQNAWPSLDFDILRTFDRLDRFLPVGFYYRQFHKPRWLWPLVEPLIRRVAGLGRIDVHATPDVDSEVTFLSADVCVIGGGPAGLAAAQTAAHAGAQVVLIDRQPRLGGHLLFADGDGAGLEKSLAAIGKLPGLQTLTDAFAFGIYEGNLVGAFQGHRLLKIRAAQIVVCTGARQRPFLFHNNDLPGIFLGDGVLRLARCHGVLAGQRAVVATDNDEGASLARQLDELGIEVVGLVDSRRDVPADNGRWPVFPGSRIVAARGSKRLRRVKIGPVEDDGTVLRSTLACDLLCLASLRVPAHELLLQAGARFVRADGEWRLDKTPAGLFAAGSVAGTAELDGAILEGRDAGARATAALGFPSAADFRPALLDETLGEPHAGQRRAAAPLGPPADKNRKAFVCLCDDMTDKDLYRAVEEGFDHIETLKRYATVGMGPCQGKVCGLTSSEVCARATGRDVNAVGVTTSRPPAVPVELRVLAAERRHQPVRRTPLHHWHEATGARWLDAGAWKRPESYGDPAGEVRAVRSQVGLIDVSTLGKIEVRGPQAVELLERVYVNTFADLKIGRTRYGLICTEEGILWDDGAVARLGPDRFYLTATTGNAEAVYRWLLMWRDTWRLDVAVQNQTAALAAMNLAGPLARDVLAPLSDIDIGAGAFPYLGCREGRVAGTPCLLMRLGFVGELGYEIHCPSALAWSLWQRLYEAGSPYGLRPFGVEAQRMLRLEKGHIIVGQDTDALSTPLEAGLEGLVKFAKPAFHGKEPLLFLRRRGARMALVGFQLADERLPLEARDWMTGWEGCQVVENGMPVGRVTSFRFSPTLNQYIGLGWVPVHCADEGSRFHVRWNNLDAAAEVVPTPFYDPAGLRLRS